VDIGIACGKSVLPAWWVPTTAAILEWERAGIKVGQIIAPDTALTDANRNRIADDFLKGDSDWLLQLDDDTVPPSNALPTLLALNEPFCAALYHAKDDNEVPVAHLRNPNGRYYPLPRYVPGEVVPVDLVGMGCTLIHRCVFEDIEKAHVLATTLDGQVMPIPRRCVSNESLPGQAGRDKRVIGGWLLVRAELGYAPKFWPFYAFTFGRTEDIWFCELAAEAGYRPVMDTGIVCKHLGHHRSFAGVNYRRRMIAKAAKEVRNG
jgi:GT2 family glycosyltransferase